MGRSSSIPMAASPGGSNIAMWARQNCLRQGPNLAKRVFKSLKNNIFPGARSQSIADITLPELFAKLRETESRAARGEIALK